MTRQDAIELLTKSIKWFKPYTSVAEEWEQAMNMAIEALQAKPKTGKWIVKQGNYCGVELKEYYCDHCGKRGALRRVFSDPEPLPNFCGNCGADMRAKNDDERGE